MRFYTTWPKTTLSVSPPIFLSPNPNLSHWELFIFLRIKHTHSKSMPLKNFLEFFNSILYQSQAYSFFKIDVKCQCLCKDPVQFQPQHSPTLWNCGPNHTMLKNKLSIHISLNSTGSWNSCHQNSCLIINFIISTCTIATEKLFKWLLNEWMNQLINEWAKQVQC